MVNRHGQHNVYTVEPADGFGLPRTVGRAELKVTEHPVPPRVLQPAQHRSRPAARRVHPTRVLTRDCSSSSEDGVIAVADVESATSPGDSPLISPAMLSSSTNTSSSKEEVIPRHRARRNAGYHPNLNREPRSCGYPRAGQCSKCNATMRLDNSVFW